MKRIVIKLLIPVGLIALLIVGAVTFWNTTTNTYKIPPNKCKLLFGYSAEEFVRNHMNFFDFSDNVVSAKLDENSYLLLTLTEQDEENWLSPLQPFFATLKTTEGVEISADYKKITLNCYQETIHEMVINISPAIPYCYMRQLFSGIDPETINIELTILDAGTGEVKIQETLSEKEFDFSLDASTFSSQISSS